MVTREKILMAQGAELDAIGRGLNPVLERIRTPVMGMGVSGRMIATGDFEYETDGDYRGRIDLALSGGYAFGEFKQAGECSIKTGGLTVLDYFAAKAIPVAYDICNSRANVNASDIAELAYQTAYAMLRERAK